MEEDTIENRLKAFCNEYGIAEKRHGSLRLLAAMAYVFGYEVDFTLKKVPPHEGDGGHRRSDGGEDIILR